MIVVYYTVGRNLASAKYNKHLFSAQFQSALIEGFPCKLALLFSAIGLGACRSRMDAGGQAPTICCAPSLDHHSEYS